MSVRRDREEGTTMKVRLGTGATMADLRGYITALARYDEATVTGALGADGVAALRRQLETVRDAYEEALAEVEAAADPEPINLGPAFNRPMITVDPDEGPTCEWCTRPVDDHTPEQARECGEHLEGPA